MTLESQRWVAVSEAACERSWMLSSSKRFRLKGTVFGLEPLHPQDKCMALKDISAPLAEIAAKD